MTHISLARMLQTRQKPKFKSVDNLSISAMTHPLKKESKNIYSKTSALKVVLCSVMLSFLGISGCSDNESLVIPEDNTAVGSSDVQTSTTHSAPDPATTDSDGQAALPATTPVKYNVADWPINETRFGLSDLDAMQDIMGNVKLTDENSLDYASSIATKYRFMEGDQPYLDMIDSQDYLEYGWYYANPSDPESTKKASVEHAQKIYQVAQGLMGKAGGQLVDDMLNGQIIRNQPVGEQQVALAKCEFYNCMLVMQKPK